MNIIPELTLPKHLENVIIPIRFLPITHPTLNRSESCQMFERLILDWYNQYKGEMNESLPCTLKLTSDDMVQLFNKIIYFDCPIHEHRERHDSFIAIFKYYNMNNIIFNIKFNVNSLCVSEEDEFDIFGNYFMTIIPEIFGPILFYNNLLKSGVSLSILYQFANINYKLKCLGLNWECFNRRMIDGLPIEIQEKNEIFLLTGNNYPEDERIYEIKCNNTTPSKNIRFNFYGDEDELMDQQKRGCKRTLTIDNTYERHKKIKI